MEKNKKLVLAKAAGILIVVVIVAVIIFRGCGGKDRQESLSETSSAENIQESSLETSGETEETKGTGQNKGEPVGNQEEQEGSQQGSDGSGPDRKEENRQDPAQTKPLSEMQNLDNSFVNSQNTDAAGEEGRDNEIAFGEEEPSEDNYLSEDNGSNSNQETPPEPGQDENNDDGWSAIIRP